MMSFFNITHSLQSIASIMMIAEHCQIDHYWIDDSVRWRRRAVVVDGIFFSRKVTFFSPLPSLKFQ